MYSVNEVAEMAGVTKRTLRYYHKIGLLEPVVQENGYRAYSDADLNKFQIILFYKELEIPLSEIKTMLACGDSEAVILERQYAMLKEKESRLQRVIELMEETLEKGSNRVTNERKFEAFKERKIRENEAEFGSEARAKYGDAVVDESNESFKNLDEDKYTEAERAESEMIALLDVLCEVSAPLEDARAREVFERHKTWLTTFAGSGQYSAEYHRALADMYVADERFAFYYNEKTKKDSVELLAEIIREFA